MEACCALLEKNLVGKEIEVVDESNRRDYVQLPDYIERRYKKGKIPPAMFANYFDCNCISNTMICPSFAAAIHARASACSSRDSSLILVLFSTHPTISSSIQATLAGRFGTSEYGRSKKAGEELMFQYGRETGAKVLVYRFPNLFGKWCRPNYNSAVATFCNNIANDLPIQVNDPNVDMELLYIDDLVDEMICALQGKEHRCEFDGVETVLTPEGRYCAAPVTHHVKLGEIVELLRSFAEQPRTLTIPEIPAGSFAKNSTAPISATFPRKRLPSR